MEYLITWPFGTKGHYHLPSGISPIFMDFLAREKKKKGEDFVLVNDSWNIQGKYTDYKSIQQLTGLSEEEINANYKTILRKHLPGIMISGKEIADDNIKKSNNIKNRLSLLPSGIYFGGQLKSPIEFRDDSMSSWKVSQQRFLQLFRDGLIYWNKDPQNPDFFLNMKELMRRVPLEKAVEDAEFPDFILKQFKNTYSVYVKDMPLSTVRGYGTPVPLIIMGDKLKVPLIEELPIETRYEGRKIDGPIATIKPLFNCYFTQEVVQEQTGITAERMFTCNDQSLVTRFNFPQAILTAYFGRDYRQVSFFNDLLVDSNGNRYSFKGDVLLSLEELTENGSSLARFLIARNTRFTGSKLSFEDARTTFKNLKKTLSKIKKEKNFSQGDKRQIYSNMFRKRIDEFDTSYEKLVKSGEIRIALNFLTDYIMQASRLDGNTLPSSVESAIGNLESIILIDQN